MNNDDDDDVMETGIFLFLKIIKEKKMKTNKKADRVSVYKIPITII